MTQPFNQARKVRHANKRQQNDHVSLHVTGVEVSFRIPTAPDGADSH